MFSREAKVEEASLARGTQQLTHRGPDHQSQWVAPHRRAGLGHARLSIIDLSTGDQPLVNEDGSIHAVVNGELYDHERITRELQSRGHRFRTKSDSEILLHLFEDYGTQALSHLRGEFAIALWDEKNSTFFAARDRFGIKPLYYAIVDEKLMLASEVKALFAMGVPAVWDRETSFQIHSALLTSPSRTLYQGVYQVPPGHYLITSGGRLQILPYWDFNYPESPIEKVDEAEVIERFRDKLEESVRLRLRADVPVGCYLSGGLDSCSVLGIAATYSAEPIQAFTLSFDRAEYDEKEVAREMAKHANARFQAFDIKASDLATHFKEALRHAETPFSNPHGIAKFLLSRYVREAGYKVVLTGEGSDEIFGGYVHFRRDKLLYQSPGDSEAEIQRKWKELREKNQVSAGLLLTDGATADLSHVCRRLGYVPSFLEVQAQGGVKVRELLHPEFLAPFAERDVCSVFLNEIDFRQLQGRDPVNQSLYLWSKTALPNYILTVLGDRMEMAHSIEGRVPFLDHELVELVTRLPVDLKIKELTEKYVLREAARPFITDTVYRRQKHPFLAPPATRELSGPLFELIQDTLRGPAAKAVPFYAPEKITKMLDGLKDMEPEKRAMLDPVLMMFTSCCLLQQEFGLS